jgi:large subunit ribosomal protein L30
MSDKPKHPCVLAVRLRGTVGDSPDVKKTLESLMLQRTFQARLLENTPANLGMLRRVKDLVAWGEVDPTVLESLLRKRSEREEGSERLDEDFVRRRFGKTTFSDLAKSVVGGELGVRELWRAGLKPRFRLHPPKGGFKRSTRRAFTDGGELGYRGPDINSLVRRMV